jgi:hypothetical protein
MFPLEGDVSNAPWTKLIDIAFDKSEVTTQIKCCPLSQLSRLTAIVHRYHVVFSDRVGYRLSMDNVEGQSGMR